MTETFPLTRTGVQLHAAAFAADRLRDLNARMLLMELLAVLPGTFTVTLGGPRVLERRVHDTVAFGMQTVGLEKVCRSACGLQLTWRSPTVQWPRAPERLRGQEPDAYCVGIQHARRHACQSRAQLQRFLVATVWERFAELLEVTGTTIELRRHPFERRWEMVPEETTRQVLGAAFAGDDQRRVVDMFAVPPDRLPVDGAAGWQIHPDGSLKRIGA